MNTTTQALSTATVMVFLLIQTSLSEPAQQTAPKDSPVLLFDNGTVTNITPADSFWPEKLRLVSVYDQARAKNMPPRVHFTLYSKWIVTKKGKKFPAEKIDRALKEIDFFPAGKTAALKITAIMANLKFKARIIDQSIIDDNPLARTIPADILNQVHPPRVKSTANGYRICFFGYIKTDSGFPREWIKAYVARIKPGIYDIRQTKTLWTEKGRYRW